MQIAFFSITYLILMLGGITKGFRIRIQNCEILNGTQDHNRNENERPSVIHGASSEYTCVYKCINVYV